MRKGLLIIVASLLVCFLPISFAMPSTQVSGSFYGRLLIGFAFKNHTDVSFTGLNSEAAFKTGYDIAAGIDYNYRPFIYEVELAYFRNKLDSLMQNGSAVNDPSGSSKVTAGFFNVYYPFKLNAPFSPYLGLGIGDAHVREKDVDAASQYVAEHSAFAYQAIAGIGIPVNKWLTIMADYRYMATAKIRYERRTTNEATHRVYRNNSINLGIVYKF